VFKYLKGTDNVPKYEVNSLFHPVKTGFVTFAINRLYCSMQYLIPILFLLGMFTLYKVLTQKPQSPPEPPKEKRVDKGDQVGYDGDLIDTESMVESEWHSVGVFFKMAGWYLLITLLAVPFLLLLLWWGGVI